jgi:hypothetical protein
MVSAGHPSTILRVIPLPIWRWGGRSGGDAAAVTGLNPVTSVLSPLRGAGWPGVAALFALFDDCCAILSLRSGATPYAAMS